MKKFIKNTLLTFVIIYTVLSLLFLVNIKIMWMGRVMNLSEEVRSYNKAYEEGREIEIINELEEESKQYAQRYGEDVEVETMLMVTKLENYLMGMGQTLNYQEVIIVVTLVLSIAIGSILSLTEKSKTKELLCFITGGILCVLLYSTIMYITGEFKGFNIFEAIMETINSLGIYYIGAYLVKIVYTYCKNKKSVKELNKEIEKNNK